MKAYLFLTFATLLLHADVTDTNISTNSLSDNADRPSRLEAGYGSDEIFSETLPYMPDVSVKERVKIQGDLRLRSQTIHDNDGTESIFRYRARVGVTAAVTDNVQFEFMLATGDGDPVSTNQTAGNFFSGKGIVVDIADVYYGYGYHEFIRLGKMKLPFYRPDKNQMIWDNDLRPEGAFAKHKLFANTDITAGAFMVQAEKENGDSKPDQNAIGLYTLQAVQYLGDFRVGGGVYIYDSLENADPLVSYGGKDNNLTKGNTLEKGHYKYGYHLVELFAQYKVIDDLSLGIDGVYNTAAPTENRAYNISAMYGSLKNNGDFKFGYYYRYTEKDAVFGMFSDSDFAGGQTDSKGSQLMGGYQIAKNTQLAFTYINATREMSSINPERFQRLHLDFKIKF